MEVHGVGNPTPYRIRGYEEILVEVRAAGLCHSDGGIFDGVGSGWINRVPIVLGPTSPATIEPMG